MGGYLMAAPYSGSGGYASPQGQAAVPPYRSGGDIEGYLSRFRAPQRAAASGLDPENVAQMYGGGGGAAAIPWSSGALNPAGVQPGYGYGSGGGISPGDAAYMLAQQRAQQAAMQSGGGYGGGGYYQPRQAPAPTYGSGGYAPTGTLGSGGATLSGGYGGFGGYPSYSFGGGLGAARDVYSGGGYVGSYGGYASQPGGTTAAWKPASNASQTPAGYLARMRQPGYGSGGYNQTGSYGGDTYRNNAGGTTTGYMA